MKILESWGPTQYPSPFPGFSAIPYLAHFQYNPHTCTGLYFLASADRMIPPERCCVPLAECKILEAEDVLFLSLYP